MDNSYGIFVLSIHGCFTPVSLSQTPTPCKSLAPRDYLYAMF